MYRRENFPFHHGDAFRLKWLLQQQKKANQEMGLPLQPPTVLAIPYNIDM